MIARAGTGTQADERFRLVRLPLGAKSFYAVLPLVVLREVRRFRPDLVAAQSPYEAFACLLIWPALRPPPKLVVELHGDWRTAARLYGSRLRRLVAPIADRVALAALRRADGTRALSPFTERLAEEATGEPPLASFPAYVDVGGFASEPPRPLPDEPAVAWVAVLERYKNVDGFARAWRIVMERLPGATLVMVGSGPLEDVVEGLVLEYPSRVKAIPWLSSHEVARLLDRSRVLVLASRSEGVPRVILEAFARSRPVVATAVGGVPDVVEPGRNGLLVAPGDMEGLADALVRVLTDDRLAAQLSLGALESSERCSWSADRWADAYLAYVERAIFANRPRARRRRRAAR